MDDKYIKNKICKGALLERRLVVRFLREKCEWKDNGDRCSRPGCHPCRWAAQIERRKHSSKVFTEAEMGKGLP